MALRMLPLWLLLLMAITLFVAKLASAAADATIVVDNFAFRPAETEIKAGSKVTFRNTDDTPHSVVAADGSFRSKALDTNDEAVFTFTRVGTVAYFCGLHPFMKGRIRVVP